MLEIDAVNGVTAGLSSFYFLQILGQYIGEYADGFGFQPGFRIESQEEVLARVEAEAQAEMIKRFKEKAESQVRTAQAHEEMSNQVKRQEEGSIVSLQAKESGVFPKIIKNESMGNE